jgi:CxxC-x17-CxxC domain-containing protein
MFGKGKVSPKSNPKGTGPELPEIVALMTKIAERLEALEKKTDLVISQTSARFSGGRERPRPVPQSSSSSQSFRQPGPSGRPGEVMPAQAHPQGSGRGRREKILYKAVCAECKKDCEIPFQPTGERPVYCKECFSKRKAGNPFKVNDGNPSAPGLPDTAVPLNVPQRQVSVTKKGVGKVTVSEIVSAPARDISQKGRNPAPEKKPKR